MLKNKNMVVEKDILQHLTGAPQKTRSIDMCISRLRRRLQQSSSDESIRAVRGFGYLLEVPDSLLT